MINNAYEVLSDPEKRKQFNLKEVEDDTTI